MDDRKKLLELAESVSSVLSDFAHTNNIDLVDKYKLSELYNESREIIADVMTECEEING